MITFVDIFGISFLSVAGQAELLTPLVFAWHRLSPLAVFASGAYFLHNGGGGVTEFAKFTVPTLTAFLKARSQSVSSIKQKLVGRAKELVVRAIGCQKTLTSISRTSCVSLFAML